MVGVESQTFQVRNGRNRHHLIPYIGNKSGFVRIFDRLIPREVVGKREIVDVFGGSGAFSIYACYRFGSEKVTYNDNNPVVVNFLRHVQSSPKKLHEQYHQHRKKSSNEHYLAIRDMPLDNGLAAAGRFLYLAKNAFSGKIRFNSSNKFNCPMRKDSKCPGLELSHLEKISTTIRHLTITNESYEQYQDSQDTFFYLDPPYMDNPHGHYNEVPATRDFLDFVMNVEQHNKVMISEQTILPLSDTFRVYRISLKRSLQYFTQNGSTEIIAINYQPEDYTDVPDEVYETCPV